MGRVCDASVILQAVTEGTQGTQGTQDTQGTQGTAECRIQILLVWVDRGWTYTVFILVVCPYALRALNDFAEKTRTDASTFPNRINDVNETRLGERGGVETLTGHGVFADHFDRFKRRDSAA